MGYTRDDSLESQALEFDQRWSYNATIAEPSYRSLEKQLDEQARELQTRDDYIEAQNEERQKMVKAYTNRILDEVMVNFDLEERFKKDLQTKNDENQQLQHKIEDLTKLLTICANENKILKQVNKQANENSSRFAKLSDKAFAEVENKNVEIRDLKEIIAKKDAEIAELSKPSSSFSLSRMFSDLKLQDAIVFCNNLAASLNKLQSS